MWYLMIFEVFHGLGIPPPFSATPLLGNYLPYKTTVYSSLCLTSLFLLPLKCEFLLPLLHLTPFRLPILSDLSKTSVLLGSRSQFPDFHFLLPKLC